MAEQPIGFVCAMPMELKPLRKPLRLEPMTIGGKRGYTGTLDGRPVVAIVTGMGTRLANVGILRLLGDYTPARVLVVGITGAVDDDIAIGTLMRPALVIDHATGREHEHQGFDSEPLSGAMWTTDIITPPKELPALRSRGVTCLDMETAAIAKVCEDRSVPWAVIRAISDRATDGSVDSEVFELSNQDGTPNARAILRYVIRHPTRIPGMARMGQNATLATRRAAAAAIDAARNS